MYSDGNRTGYPESGYAVITSGDGDTPLTVVDINDTELFVVTSVQVQYANGGTGNPDVVVYDESDGTASADVSDDRFYVGNLQADDDRGYENLYLRDFEEGVLVQSDGDNHDADIVVNVQGFTVNALSDMSGVA